jgi:hypothetical protein
MASGPDDAVTRLTRHERLLRRAATVSHDEPPPPPDHTVPDEPPTPTRAVADKPPTPTRAVADKPAAPAGAVADRPPVAAGAVHDEPPVVPATAVDEVIEAVRAVVGRHQGLSVTVTVERSGTTSTARVTGHGGTAEVIRVVRTPPTDRPTPSDRTFPADRSTWSDRNSSSDRPASAERTALAEQTAPAQRTAPAVEGAPSAGPESPAARLADLLRRDPELLEEAGRPAELPHPTGPPRRPEPPVRAVRLRNPYPDRPSYPD